MRPVLFMPERTESQYALLGAFAAQVGSAARRMGLCVNPQPSELIDIVRSEKNGVVPILLFFNHVGNPARIRDWSESFTRPGSDLEGMTPPAAVQWIVDHPLHVDLPTTEQFAAPAPSGFGNRFCLSMVADDDLHLVKLRFPSIATLRVWHGVDEASLCEESTLEASHLRAGARDIDVLVAGSIASDSELAALRAPIPSALHGACEEMIRLRTSTPWMSFGQAYDASMPAALSCSDQWGLMGLLFKYVTASVNRLRRVSMLAALSDMSGLRTVVVGGPAWTSVIESLRGVTYAGEVRYQDLSQWINRAKVALCVNPTQFTHAFSERLLIAMAAGAAAVSDDRLLVRREFAPDGDHDAGSCVRLFRAECADSLREHVHRLIENPGERAAIASNARRRVEQSHLWRHRVASLLCGLGLAAPATPNLRPVVSPGIMPVGRVVRVNA